MIVIDCRNGIAGRNSGQTEVRAARCWRSFRMSLDLPKRLQAAVPARRLPILLVHETQNCASLRPALSLSAKEAMAWRGVVECKRGGSSTLAAGANGEGQVAGRAPRRLARGGGVAIRL